jgi:hypothetical protein
MKILTEIIQAYKNVVQICDGKKQRKIRNVLLNVKLQDTVFPASKDPKSDKTHPIFQQAIFVDLMPPYVNSLLLC